MIIVTLSFLYKIPSFENKIFLKYAGHGTDGEMLWVEVLPFINEKCLFTTSKCYNHSDCCTLFESKLKCQWLNLKNSDHGRKQPVEQGISILKVQHALPDCCFHGLFSEAAVLKRVTPLPHAHTHRELYYFKTWHWNLRVGSYFSWWTDQYYLFYFFTHLCPAISTSHATCTTRTVGQHQHILSLCHISKKLEQHLGLWYGVKLSNRCNKLFSLLCSDQVFGKYRTRRPLWRDGKISHTEWEQKRDLNSFYGHEIIMVLKREIIRYTVPEFQS